jgi:hypothetical protein
VERINNVKGRGWWDCARCGRWRPVTMLHWQNLNVSLRCEYCYDNPAAVLYSQRTTEIARILKQVPRFGEPEFEPMLAEPDFGGTTNEV